MIRRILISLLLLAALLALPFFCRRSDGIAAAGGKADRLVIISAHNKSVRDEYEIAFRRHYREKFGKDVILDFRNPGGTSDIMRYIDDRFTAEFRYAYAKNPSEGKWQEEFASIFRDPASDHPVRKQFLSSDVGIGIDLFAGGGTFNQEKLARYGYAVDGGVQKRHPEYFAETVIPPAFGGERLYDPQGRYYGVVLSTFGIACNLDRLREMKDSRLPERWRDLGEERFFSQLVLADPSKSGSANKCYEIVIQQCMAESGSPASGWTSGLNLLKRIFANARTVTDSASQVVRDVATGEAAAGTAIDTYGFAEVQWSRRCFGESKVRYLTPKGGTAVSSDPIQMLRGAPNRIVAERFIDFLLSTEGQKLHAFRAGIPGGAVKSALNRPAIRKDLYTPENRKFFFEPEYDPYASGADFVYHPEWTGRYYTLLQMVIKSLMLDAQQELREAWRAIIAAGGPEKVPQAMAEFNALPFAYAEAGKAAASLRSSKTRTAADVAATLRSWSEFAQKHYRQAKRLAEEGK